MSRQSLDGARTGSERFAAVLAVVPDYRAEFLKIVRASLESEGVRIAAGGAHLVASVQSGALDGLVQVQNIPLLGRRMLWQRGGLRVARGAESLVVDLNPRSLTAWWLIVTRRLRRKRVVVWGHLFPRAGAESRTAPLRHFMRHLADGVICYTWKDLEFVRAEQASGIHPGKGAWVAANALYTRDALTPAATRADAERRDILYVGRLVDEKKPGLLVEAFARLLRSDTHPETLRLVFVGDGDARPALEAQVRGLGLAGSVEFAGKVSDYHRLREHYSRALCSVSPGYVGLSLTQSLGFGVPMVVADDEPHAPEVELMSDETGVWFRADDPDDLARAIRDIESNDSLWFDRRDDIADVVRQRYSAEIMARGFVQALRNERGQA